MVDSPVIFLADATTVENSHAASEFGAVLGWLLVGLAIMWGVAIIARRVERELMPAIPILVGAVFVGLLGIGLMHHLGF